MTQVEVGPLELLVIQPTPFCNINCSYCYLPERQDRRKIARQTLERTFDWVFASGLVREPFTLLWHAGEPMVMPPSFYDLAADLLATHDPDGSLVCQSFQTNATLIDQEWCDLIRRRGIHVGVSVDGPAFLHDRCRRTRQGAGTLDRVLTGIRLLQTNAIPLHVITVLTAESLAYPDELFDFYRANGITDVAFNVEEIEGPNTTSSLGGRGSVERFRHFLSRFLDLALSADPPLQVREFDCSVGAALGPRPGRGDRVQESKPFAIVNVGCDGTFSTYSPELLGLPSPRHGGFALGNIATDSLASVLASPRFLALDEEIARGIEMCRQECRYFRFCGGGPPGNKFFENGTFASTETLFCRLHKQVCLDVSLDKLERMKTPA
ncbi:MAG: cyclophane-forming radical SAM/SPASM peptide maturase GrrM/OscB [Gemmataceae bacterium]